MLDLIYICGSETHGWRTPRALPTGACRAAGLQRAWAGPWLALGRQAAPWVRVLTGNETGLSLVTRQDELLLGMSNARDLLWGDKTRFSGLASLLQAVCPHASSTASLSPGLLLCRVSSGPVARWTQRALARRRSTCCHVPIAALAAPFSSPG